MARTTKILGFSVPPSMVEEVEQIAKEERRTKSELFREMLRVYRSYRKKCPEPEIDDEWVMQVIREAEEEEKRTPMIEEGDGRPQRGVSPGTARSKPERWELT